MGKTKKTSVRQVALIVGIVLIAAVAAYTIVDMRKNPAPDFDEEMQRIKSERGFAD